MNQPAGLNMPSLRYTLRTQNSHLDGDDLDEPAREEVASNGVPEPETFGNGVVFKATGKKGQR